MSKNAIVLGLLVVAMIVLGHGAWKTPIDNYVLAPVASLWTGAHVTP